MWTVSYFLTVNESKWKLNSIQIAAGFPNIDTIIQIEILWS